MGPSTPLRFAKEERAVRRKLEFADYTLLRELDPLADKWQLQWQLVRSGPSSWALV